jgi:hypothetical protein
MSTEREIVYNILNIHAGGRISDDFIPAYNQVRFMLKYCRAMFVRRDLDANWFSHKIYEQDLGELKMIPVDKADDICFTLGCDVYRTEAKLPKFLRLKSREGITFTGAVDKTTRIDLILPERVPFIKYSKYTNAIPRLYYLNNYIYSTSDDLSYINVRGILENPEDANKYLCDGVKCYDHDSEYPLPADMIQQITELILSKEMTYMLRTAPDTQNDSVNENNVNSNR